MSVSQSVDAWADPVLTKIDKRMRWNRYRKIVTVILALTAGIMAYYFYGLFSALVIFFLIFFLSVLVGAALPSDPTLTLPQWYSLYIIRLYRRATDPNFALFEFTFRHFLERIDEDLDELTENLAASKTVGVLTGLREFLLKFASAVADKGQTVNPTTMKRIMVTIHQGADCFHEFKDIEEFYPILRRELDSQDVSKILPYRFPTSRWRPLVDFLRPLYNWPFPVYIALIVVLGGLLPVLILLWFLPQYLPLTAVLAIFWAAVALFQQQIRRSLGAVFRERLRQTLSSAEENQRKKRRIQQVQGTAVLAKSKKSRKDQTE